MVSIMSSYSVMAVMSIVKNVVNSWPLGCMVDMSVQDTMMPSMIVAMVTMMNMSGHVNRKTVVNWPCN